MIPGASRRLENGVRKLDDPLILRFCQRKHPLTAGIIGDVVPTRNFSGSAVRDDQRDVIRLFSRTEVLYGRNYGVEQ